MPRPWLGKVVGALRVGRITEMTGRKTLFVLCLEL
jgi:hypothetical protein